MDFLPIYHRILDRIVTTIRIIGDKIMLCGRSSSGWDVPVQGSV